VSRKLSSFPPYNALKMDEDGCLSTSHPELDLWSIGIVILEILVGTELVLAANTAHKVRDLLAICS
jgi:hypothetical protein